MATKILVAGGTGLLGKEVLKILKTQNIWTRTLTRSEKKSLSIESMTSEVFIGDAINTDDLIGSCKEVDIIFSSLGASVGVSAGTGFRGFHSVDFVGNKNLLDEAKRQGVKRFVYVSAHIGEGYRSTAYIQAHEKFVRLLHDSGIEYTIIRPTGLFSSLLEFVSMAKRGAIPLFGRGDFRTNPVHERDVAEICVANLFAGPKEVSVGGPDVLSRKDIAKLAFEAHGEKPRYLFVPSQIPKFGSKIIRLFHPRLGECMEFVVAVSTSDAIAPQKGKAHLGIFFKQSVESKSIV